MPSFHALCFPVVATRLQEARLNVLKDLLRQRDEAQKDVTSERLMQIYSKLQQDKETKLHKINHDHVRGKTTAGSGRTSSLHPESIIRGFVDSLLISLFFFFHGYFCM